MKALGLAAVLWATASGLAYGQAAQDRAAGSDVSRDWSRTLREDALSIHASLLDSHPGPHDDLNPQFRQLLDQGLARALERAEQTRDMGGWWWGLREFIAGFNDGHVSMGFKDKAPDFGARWPGFLTRYVGDEQRVAVRDGEGDDLPPVGARLVQCDGMGAEALAQARVGQFRGRWFLTAMKVRWGNNLFLDEQNPWVKPLSQCTFEVDGAVRTYDLNWRDGGEALPAAMARLRPSPDRFGVEELADGGFWIAAPTFDGNPQGPHFAKLTGIIDTMTAQAEAMRAAPYVVFDLRGNGGGSSNWSRRMGQALWGEDWMEAHKPQSSEGVDWRVSQANRDAMAAFRDQLRETGANPEVLGYIEIMVAGMDKAREAGQIFWREDLGEDEDEVAAPSDAPLRVRGRVFVLTDAACASACLDAVDLWKPAGAIQIGRETAADTVYMDVRLAEVPSGLVQVAVPMKVYRGRARGNNEPHMPDHVLPVETLSEDELRAAIRGLAARP